MRTGVGWEPRSEEVGTPKPAGFWFKKPDGWHQDRDTPKKQALRPALAGV